MKSFESLVGPETRAALAEHERLKGAVSRCVPAAAAAHLVHCRLADGRLRLVLDSASWVAKLRFGERQLVRALVAGGTRVRQVSWHVAPHDPTPLGVARREAPADRAPARPTRTAPPRSAAHVASVAEALPEDAVGRALRQLARSMARRRTDG